jgi:Arabinose-binding domain of AraC transcription regulator, N-term
LLLFAKHLFAAATVVAIAPAGSSMMTNRSSSALNSEKGLASIPMAQGGLSRLAIARLKSAGVSVAPLLKRAGLAPEAIADPEERLSVQSQIRLLDEAASALKDDCLGFTLARDFDPRGRWVKPSNGLLATAKSPTRLSCSDIERETGSLSTLVTSAFHGTQTDIRLNFACLAQYEFAAC